MVYGKNSTGAAFETYCDSDHGGDPDTSKSTGGFAILMGNSAVLWGAKLHRQVSMSSTEAEYVTAAATGSEIIWLRNFFEEIGCPIDGPSPLFLDSASAIQVLKNPEHQTTMRHVHRSYNWIREKIENGAISVCHIPGDENLADIFTKPLRRPKFVKCRAALGLCYI